jgi:D-3-phosphoglycerate dehydrogenase / 2-oxoglutarate reductase
MKILANDGIDNAGKAALEGMGFTVITDKVAQDQLGQYIQTERIVGLLVRSATTARKDLIDACPDLKFIGRGGVGIDNIDAEYARSKGIHVFNTPASSSQAVAELVMSLLFASARFTFDAGAHMPANGAIQFETLKKKYAKGTELREKTLGIIGFGRIGQSLAAYALGCGMKVIAFDAFPVNNTVTLFIEGYGALDVKVPMMKFEDLLAQSDFISLHVPKQKDGSAVIAAAQIAQLKKGAVLVNTARGGVIDETALMDALTNGTVRMACLDVFNNEPSPNPALLTHPGVIATPHIGASTAEAQERIGLEIAAKVGEIMGITA